MNFFGRNKFYLRPPKKSAVPNFDDLRQQYVRFCESPIVSSATSAREFDELCALDSVAQIAFKKDIEDICLIIQTKGVILRDNSTGYYHDIGEMMFVMRRRPNPEIYFYNRTRVIKENDSWSFGGFHHPHVPDNGIICSSYRDRISQELAVGRVLSATIASIDAVNTYGPHPAYCEIHHWPIVKLLPENEDA